MDIGDSVLILDSSFMHDSFFLYRRKATTRYLVQSFSLVAPEVH